MVHVEFNRPARSFKVFDIAAMRYDFTASGDAWGNYVDGVRKNPLDYGHDASIAPGHYRLTYVEWLNPKTMAEGPCQIYVDDLRDKDVQMLVSAGKARFDAGTGILTDGAGNALPIGGLAKYGRSEIMVHGGGSNLGVPRCYAPEQPLCRTEGCTRLYNSDLVIFGHYLEPQLRVGRICLYTVIGDSAACDC